MQTEYYFDFAGSGVVHLLGATCSIIGCYFMGPRIGRFEVTHQHFRYSHLKGLLVLLMFVCFLLGQIYERLVYFMISSN